MEFQQTGLPDRQIFRHAFEAGWGRYLDQFDHDVPVATAQYVKGPVAMARLIFGHGGECRQVAAAACLAGPAIFCEKPQQWISKKLVDFSREVIRIDAANSNAEGRIPKLSSDARLFLQASAIMLLEQLSDCRTCALDDREGHRKSYNEALKLYSAARGHLDTYRLDTRFEIAAMKGATALEAQPHVWARARETAAAARI
jgi:hypothetical protein